MPDDINKMNPVVHFELPSVDPKRMSEFYTTVFGWKTKMLGPEMNHYVLATTSETDEKGMIKAPGRINGGFAPRTANNQHPGIVIAVPDIREAMKKVEAAGGKVLG